MTLVIFSDYNQVGLTSLSYTAVRRLQMGGGEHPGVLLVAHLKYFQY
jgi:hypothetical protein